MFGIINSLVEVQVLFKENRARLKINSIRNSWRCDILNEKVFWQKHISPAGVNVIFSVV